MNKKTIILVVVLVLVALSAAYFFLGQGGSEPAALNTSGKPALSGQVVPKDTDSVVGQKFLATLLKMQDLNLDRSILQDVVYLALKDMSRPLPEQAPGRENPFSPLEISGTANGAGALSLQTSAIQSASASMSPANGSSQVVDVNKTDNSNSSSNITPPKKVTKPKPPASNATSGSNNSSNIDTGVGGGFISP